MKNMITISRNETKPKLSEHFDVVVSLTTYGDRIRKGNLSKVIDRILFSQTSRIRLKLVVNVMPEDELLFSEKQREYFRQNNVELYVCEKNLRPHLKYFYTMMRYREYPVITIDDDCLYDETLVEDLWNSYADHPDCVSARRCHLMASDKNNFLLPYSKWLKKFTGIKTPTHELFATGVGGVLYPPNILKISGECLDDICRSITADDVYLKKREQDLGVKVVYCGDNPDSYENLPEWKEGALQLDNNGGGGNDQIIKNLNFKPMVNLYGSRRLNVFMRLCDSIDCVNNNLCKNRKREFGNGKKDVIITCMTEFSNALCQARLDGFEIILTMIDDGLDQNTVDEIDSILDKNEILYKWTNSNGTGNISSFRTCFDSALRLKDDEYVMFAEDDYLWDRNSLSEIIRFLNMFGENRNDIWMNPTSDIGDNKIVPTDSNGYLLSGETLPSSKNGTGIWWKRTWHSTSTFVTSVKQLKKHISVFKSMFNGQKLDQYQRNKIYQVERCYTPVESLMQHYQKSKTMYWFDSRNTERERPFDYKNREFNFAALDDTMQQKFTPSNYNLNIESLFRNSFVISIDSARLQIFYNNLTKAFPNINIRPRPMFGFKGIPGVFGIAQPVDVVLTCKNKRYTTSTLNCLISHMQCIHTAQALNLPYVMIFEDDAVFDPSFSIEQINETLSKIPYDCTGLALGFLKTVKLKSDKDKLFNKSNITGSHAYMVFRNGYEDFAKQYNESVLADRMFDNINGFYVSKRNFFTQLEFIEGYQSINKNHDDNIRLKEFYTSNDR